MAYGKASKIPFNKQCIANIETLKEQLRKSHDNQEWSKRTFFCPKATHSLV
jgi:hypothetical protein